MSETVPEVRTTTGLVRGRSENGLAVFRGIPFASPPVGVLRFAAPQPADAWDGVREVFEFGPPPPQSLVLGPSSNPATGDDWLTVNVWSPDLGAALPVMVWVYGGAYAIGQSGDPSYDGTRLAGEGDVVVVTFNHRLGVDGFGQVEGAPANRGLLDQVAALEWVRVNITGFGGDPANVTVFGESAGAGSIAALLAMPRAAGLFRRAITQSAPGTFFSKPFAVDIATEIASLLDCAPTVEDLRSIPTADLVAASDTLATAMDSYVDRWGAAAYLGIPFAPVVDGDVLPRTPFEALADGAGRNVELITGHTRDEYRLLLAADGRLGNLTDDDAATALQMLAPEGYGEAYPDATAEQLYELVHSDWLFRMPSHRLAEAQVAGGGRAYVYELAWPDTGLGACHGLDVPLVFGTTPLLGFLLDPSEMPDADQVSQLFRAAWTAFAHTGDPGWPEYETTNRRTARFTTELSVTAYPEETSRQLWASHGFGPLR
ncbi:carboxylesterase family protein [Kribbella sp. NPDC000426]|uniref:carboxylesterase/lipase family protein n=1 Tax=Kribbella sp. NPDC000426 TaxID=3154255 RepID=UPI003325D804